MTHIQGYVIVHKQTGERLGDLYSSITGAKTSFYSYTRRDAKYSRNHKHLSGKRFNEQEEFTITPLVLQASPCYESETRHYANYSIPMSLKTVSVPHNMTLEITVNIEGQAEEFTFSFC